MSDETTDLTTVEELPLVQTLERPMTVQQLTYQSLLIHKILKDVMVEGIHYGVIPGTGEKPTLYQPGAEKICSCFRLAPKARVEDLSDPDDNRYRYRVAISLYTIKDSLFVGEAVGEASSDEEKYQWEAAVCEEQYECLAPDEKRIKWRKDKRTGTVTQIQQVRRNAADLANTVLKMAYKRAFISVTRGATAASDLLQVDLDDEAVAAIVRDELDDEKPTVTVKKKAPPAPLIPYGPAKGKRITEAETAHLEQFKAGKEQAFADGKVPAQFQQSDRLLLDAITAELASRKQATGTEPAAITQSKLGTLSQNIAERPPMNDEAWTQVTLLFDDQFQAICKQVKAEFKVKSTNEVKPEDRWRFHDRVQALSLQTKTNAHLP